MAYNPAAESHSSNSGSCSLRMASAMRKRKMVPWMKNRSQTRLRTRGQGSQSKRRSEAEKDEAKNRTAASVFTSIVSSLRHKAQKKGDRATHLNRKAIRKQAQEPSERDRRQLDALLLEVSRKLR